MAIDSLRYTTLRSDGEQLNGKQQTKPVVAAALSESSSGVNRWRTLTRAGLAECLRHKRLPPRASARVPSIYSSAMFLWELRTPI